jgi:hypothetical protein
MNNKQCGSGCLVFLVLSLVVYLVLKKSAIPWENEEAAWCNCHRTEVDIVGASYARPQGGWDDACNIL